MSDTQNFGFGKFVPGFDFLQNLAKSASAAQMPSLASWVAPTLDVKELEKRIADLRAVHFWLEQNAAALNATIQALEVQKMTLATLKGMNVGMEEMMEAFKFKMPADGAAASKSPNGPAFDLGSAAKASSARASATKPVSEAKAKAAEAPASVPDGAAAMKGIVDPMQWWGSLTQQFQQIAANALKDASKAPLDMAAGMARETAKVAEAVTRPATKRTAKTAAHKTATTRRAAKKPAR